MKLDFLGDISNGGKYPDADPKKLVRLYDFSKNEALALQKNIQAVIIENGQELKLATLSFIHPINCQLTLQLSNKDIGIVMFENSNFNCSLTVQTYKTMIILIEPFCENEMNDYQWLYDLDTEIDFLFSPGAVGSW